MHRDDKIQGLCKFGFNVHGTEAECHQLCHSLEASLTRIEDDDNSVQYDFTDKMSGNNSILRDVVLEPASSR